MINSLSTPIPILLYHSIAEQVAEGFRTWALSPARFADHLHYLHQQRYTPLTVTQMVRAMRRETEMPLKPVVITFDDGFLDFYTDALPLLCKYDMPSTLYVTTGYVGSTSRWLDAAGEGQRPMMEWSAIQEVERLGVEIGAHTHTHPQLDTLGAERVWNEIARSKWLLEEQLGHQVESFAYPHGYHSRTIKRLVQRAGFSSACAVKHALSAINDDHFSLARVIITNETTVEELERLLTHEVLAVAPQGEALRTKVWRVARWGMKAFSAGSYTQDNTITNSKVLA